MKLAARNEGKAADAKSEAKSAVGKEWEAKSAADRSGEWSFFFLSLSYITALVALLKPPEVL